MAIHVWPYKPLDNFTEILEWKTDVFSSIGSEQRQGLRATPRREFSFSHLMSPAMNQGAEQIVYGNEAYLVPDWTQVDEVSSIVAGSDQLITPNDPCVNFSIASRLLIWKTPASYEVVDLTIDSTGIYGSIANNWSNIKMMPLMEAYAPGGFDSQTLTKAWSRGRINFRITENFDDPNDTYISYRSLPVMTDCPKLLDGLESSLNFSSKIVDNDTGLFIVLRDRTFQDATYTMRWRVTNSCRRQALRQWLMSRQGRLSAFWLSSGVADFEVIATILSTDTSITVDDLPGPVSLFRPSFDIEIVLFDGTIYRRNVPSWISTGISYVLDIDSQLGANISTSSIERVSMLRCIRHNQDRIELVHQAPESMRVSVLCKEVPYPT